MTTADEATDSAGPDAAEAPIALDVTSVINIEEMERRRDEYSATYQSASPFDHIVIDDVLPADVLERVYAELAQMNSGDWNSYVHFNERKYSNTDVTSWGPTLRAVSDAFASDRFVSFLETVSGFDGLHADVTLDGGGVHRCYRGGFLNVHTDFTAHHTIKNWRRRVNLLLYLNPVWDPEWGGALELWNRDMTRCETKVDPTGNRILLFTTGEHSFHGHPDPLTSPEGLARESLALYYFTEEAKPLAKSTDYRSRPDDGAHRFLIFADKKALAVYDVVKRRFHVSDAAVRRVMSKFSTPEVTDTTVDGDVAPDRDDPDGGDPKPDDPTIGEDVARTTRFARTTADTVVDVVVALICVGVATAWTFNPFRRQFTSGTFSNFYELQARSFINGHLSVEPGLLGIEAFIRDGHEYMYFGPLLSLFRVPFVALSYELDGRLTVLSLLLGTLVLYWQSIKLLDYVLELMHPAIEGPRSTERWFRLGGRASVAAGTVVLTLLAIPWSYHEAHLWSAAMFIALLNQMILFPRNGGKRVWIFGLILFTVVLNRPTTAYAGLIGIGCLLVILLARKTVPRRALLTLAGWSAAAFIATVTVNYAKFRRPFGIPMEDQFFTKVDANRAQMLEIYDNKYFQLEFMPSNLWAYFKPNGVDVSTTFPFIGTPRSIPWVWGDAFYDATYRTASVTATNPLLFIGSIVGVVAFVMLFRKDSFWTLSPPVLAGLAAAGGVAGWGYMSTRYLTDFLPGMLMLTAIGIAAFVRYVDHRSEPFAPAFVLGAKIVGVSLIAWSIIANVAIAFTYSFSVGDSAADVSRLLSAQDAVSSIIGPDIEDRVVFVDTLPYDRLHPVPAGTLAIVGDCEALYYSNGEPVDTWIQVEYGESAWRRDFEVTPSSTLEPGYEVELVRLTETPDIGDTDQYWFSLVLVVDDVRHDDNLLEFTLAIRDSYGELTVETLDMPLDEPSELSVTFDKNRRVFFAELDGQNKLYGHFDMDPLYDTAETGVSFLPSGNHGGFEVTELTPDTPWCDRLAAAAS